LDGDNFLGKDPATAKVKRRPVDAATNTWFLSVIKTIAPEER
jgi:hypothetical protein